MTYEERMCISKTVAIIKKLNPEDTDSNSVTYLKELDEAIYRFFKSRLTNWQFDLFRNRYDD